MASPAQKPYSTSVYVSRAKVHESPLPSPPPPSPFASHTHTPQLHATGCPCEYLDLSLQKLHVVSSQALTSQVLSLALMVAAQ